MKPDIHLHIEKLLLDGFSKNDGFYIKSAIQSELKLLLASGSQQAVEQASHRKLAAPSIHVDLHSKPEQLGKQIARSIYGGLTTKHHIS